jgi:hypothetical protein
MTLQIRRVEVWSGAIPDRPGAAAATLEALSRAGADLQYVFSRPHPSDPDFGLIFLAPVTGPEQERAARSAGLAPASGIAMLCVEGANRPGLGSLMMSWLAVAGINLRGLSVSAADKRFTAYLAFENHESATMALQVLAGMA